MLTPSFVFVTTVLQLSASTAPERGSTTYPRELVAKCVWITGYQNRSLDGADNNPQTNKQICVHEHLSSYLRPNKKRVHTNRRTEANTITTALTVSGVGIRGVLIVFVLGGVFKQSVPINVLHRDLKLLALEHGQTR